MNKRTCPHCGVPLKRVRIVNGYPDRELFERAERGEVVLGGCEPEPTRWACANCHAPVGTHQ